MRDIDNTTFVESCSGYFSNLIMNSLEEYRDRYKNCDIGALKFVPIALAGQYALALLIPPLIIETVVRLSVTQIATLFTYIPHEATAKYIDEKIVIHLQNCVGLTCLILQTTILYFMANCYNLSLDDFCQRMQTYNQQAKNNQP